MSSISRTAVANPDHERPADDAVANVQFDQMRHGQQGREILVVQAVAGVDAQSQGMRLPGGGGQFFGFLRALVFAMKIFGERAGVQFNELRAGLGGGFHLRRRPAK